MKTITRILLCTFTCLGITSSSFADFQVVNRSSETIQVALLNTFVKKDGFVYWKGWYTLGPGEKHIFGTGHMHHERIAYLHIVTSDCKFYFDKRIVVEDARYNLNTVKAPYFRSEMSDVGNRYVASEAARANFLPLRNLIGGSRLGGALRIQPKVGWGNGFEIVYQGRNNRIRSRIWK
jgi:hypothetical protein